MIANGAVRSGGIADGAVGSADIADGAVGSADIADAVGGQAYGRHHDAQVIVNDSAAPPVAGADDVLTLSVPAGSYLILAKAQAGNSGIAVIDCRTIAGGDFDASESYLGSSGSTTISMSVLHQSSAAITVHLACDTDGTGLANQGVARIKIIALKLRSITNTPG